MPTFEYSGGALCLDFANTWGDRNDPGNDKLGSYRDLLEWADGAGLVDKRERSELEKLAHREPSRAEGVLRTALELRDVVFRICANVAAGEAPNPRDVTRLNTALDAVPRQRLCCSGSCCEWEWPAGTPDLRRPMWPVIQSAAELVTSPEISRVRQCAAPDCNWLFLDTSRGGRRRWCDMSTCGNRAKARRYYERHHRNT